MSDNFIMREMEKIIIVIGDEPTEQRIKHNAGAICNLAGECRKTDFYQKNKHQVDKFKQWIDTEYPEEKLKRSYLYLLNRIGDSPTQFHLKGAIILNLPIVDDYLKAS